MGISTNSIIHYTKSKKALKEILKEGFKPSYCYEKVLSTEKGFLHAAYPMVSFCDIRLSQVKEHVDSYGYYGIGLTKEWSNKNKLNPVLYFDQNSELINYIRGEFQRLNEKHIENEIEFKDFEHLIKILSYSKNYSGDLERKEKKIENYRYYDEREWRYVPNIEKLGSAKSYITSDVYKEDKQKHNMSLNHIRLHFDTKDISYIIVKNQKEIEEMTRYIRNIFSNTCSMQDMEILLTRIITIEQILYDF